ncbi:LacI family DNA-binding transcriptional regulator [Lacisediminihabitans sp. H27-G8]|uniref:LacI family DNA-binding transcriptional regulator n=1 Tax=Lacisediminihabitans sp. H27-G8 TaxID=3111909 RepID=UPI0038FD3308
MTIADIAQQAGLSKGAVSYALNNKPGVSADTRERVQAIASGMGWHPSLAAQSLTTSRSNAIGLMLQRPARMLGNEPFYMEFIAGIETIIAPNDIALVLHMVENSEREVAIYERWWAQGRVDGVLLVDVVLGDPRVEAVNRLGLPAVAITTREAARGLPHLWTDDRAAMTAAARYLIRLGHKRIARVSGLAALDHSVVRNSAFTAAAAEAGLDSATIISTDFSGEAGSRATRDLMSAAAPPTAIIYDNDIMAVAGLSVAAEMGIDVPRELSLLAWDDSPLCRLTHPALSAMNRDVSELGGQAAEMLLTLINGGHVEDRESALPVLIPRGSTNAVSP